MDFLEITKDYSWIYSCSRNPLDGWLYSFSYSIKHGEIKRDFKENIKYFNIFSDFIKHLRVFKFLCGNRY